MMVHRHCTGRGLTAAATLALTLALAACASSAATSGAPSATGSAAASAAKRPLVLGYTSTIASWSSVYVANDENLFAKHGLQVNVRDLQANVANAALLSGEVDFLTSTTPITSILAGGDVTFIARLAKGPVFSIFANKDIARAEDLRGKVIADTLPGTGPDNALKTLLAKHGLKEGDVQIVHTPNAPAELATLASGQAVAGIFPVPQTLAARNAGFHEVTGTVQEGVPGLTATVATKVPRVKTDAPTARAVLTALKDATTFMYNNADRTKQIVGKYTKTDPGPDLDETYAVYKSVWEVGPIQPEDITATLATLDDPRAATADPQAFFDNSIVTGLP
jgi:NitT/TauT family transport system substrate-binding protein